MVLDFSGGDGHVVSIPDGDLAIANPYSVTTIHLPLVATSMGDGKREIVIASTHARKSKEMAREFCLLGHHFFGCTRHSSNVYGRANY